MRRGHSQQIQNTKLRSVSSSEICSVRMGSSQLSNAWETTDFFWGATYSFYWLEKEQFCCKSLVWYLGHIFKLHICILQVMWLTPAWRSNKDAAMLVPFFCVEQKQKRQFFFIESRRGNAKLNKQQ